MALSELSLPPPCSYEELYSSYQNEWDLELERKRSRNNDESVTDLEWVTLQSGDVYLLACTELGEILVWNLETVKENSGASSARLLKPCARCKISNHSHPFLNTIRVVKIPTQGELTNKSKKRQRQTDVHSSQQEALLIVAGDGGLWSIPLLDVLNHPWKTCDSISAPPASLLKLSNRSILKIQIHPNHECQRLFALERDTNTLAIWNLAAILETHANAAASSGESIDASYDLSRIFSTKLQRRRINSKMGCNERATTISIHANSKDGGKLETTLLFVGTNRSRLWIVPLLNNGHLSNTSEPYFLSLHDPKSNNNEDASWKVADILVTKGSTWWTVAAARDKPNDASGLLVTWHASTGMVVARQETRETITTILLQDSYLYSAANEGAITVWDSAFLLKKKGRFWTSPPSSKAMAILKPTVEHTILAVAGVGDMVDLFVDQCRVQTARIGNEALS